ncbi:restriction endonuclease subunit S [Phaeodactylibacter xiamenensis]|uniref:restriction endonuclease subunit S n=1 Tax=Phaeodactylibacter xiamenensis TaxID=1524460 RepID=UPI003CCC0935
MKWERVELGEVCDFQGGSQPPKKEWIATPQIGYIRMLQIRDFTQGKKDHIAFVRDSGRLKKCSADDILIGRYGASIGKILTGLEGAYNVAMIKTIPNEKKLSKDFLYYYLVSPFFQSFINGIGTRAAQAGFNKEDIRQAQIPLPPLSEQRRLAARLDKADAVRQKSRALVDVYAELGRSVFLEVFGDPVRNERGWEVVELVNHVKILGGGTPSKKNKSFYTGEIPWVSPKDMKSLFIDSSIDKITDEAIKNSSTKLIPKDSVLMVVRSGILKKQLPVGINICPVTLNQDMKAFVCKEKLNPYYLLYLFLVLAPNILKSVRGTTADNISSDVLKKLQIPLPPLPLQTRFAAMVANIEAQRRLAERQLEAAEAVFGGVLQGTFEG